MATFGPADSWPDHRQSWFRDTFDLARARGWSLEGPTGHNAYRLYCPTRDCNFVAYSTGRGGESAAKMLAKKITRCTHGHVASLGRVEDLLGKAEKMIRAAGLLLERRRTHSQALAAMDVPGTSDEDIEELLVFADELLAEAESLGVDVAEEEPEPHVANAERQLDEATEALSPLPPEAPAVIKLRSQAKDLRLELERLRSSLASS